MKRKQILSLIGFMVLAGFMSVSFLYGDVTLAVPEKIQEYSNWCWDASSQAVIFYYNQSPRQCEIANYAWNSNKCCTATGTFYSKLQGCNKANWGITRTAVDSSRTWAQCVSDLDNGKPIVMRWGWTSGGGHMLVVYGYITTGSYLKYMDPWPGEGYTTALYTWVNSSSDHDWTHSLYSLTK